MQAIEVKPRLNALKQALAEKNIDAILVVSEANVTYLSGYTNKEAYLFISGRDNGSAKVFITDFRYTEQAEEECPDFEILMCRNDSPSFSRLVAQICEKYGVKRLAFERPHISYQQFNYVSTDAVGVELIATDGMVENLRQVKDAAETERLRQACAGTDLVFTEICGLLRPGLSEREVEWEILSSLRRHGLDAGFPSIVVSGPRSSLPHGVPSDKPLASGEFVTMDFGGMYRGYHADITRTVFLGRPTAEQRQFYDIVLTANLRAEQAIRAGIPATQIDAVARDYIDQLGYGANFGHGLGHGVGLDIHERPFMSRVSADMLQAGNFITVEPGIYIPGLYGVRIEDTVLVKEDGCEVLFKAPKELICL